MAKSSQIFSITRLTYVPQSQVGSAFRLNRRESALDLLQRLVDGDRLQFLEFDDATEL